MSESMDAKQPFTDPAIVARYVENTPRKVPGFADLHRMAMLLLAEHAAGSARILVLGAGGGLELKAFAEAQPDWLFVGIDPSAEMLGLAAQILEPHAGRVEFIHGLIDDAPSSRFDGATCLLTLHFLDREERLRTLGELRRRLKPGAPLIVAHHNDPGDGQLRRWLARSVAFANHGPVDFDAASSSADMMAEKLPLLTADEDETLLAEAGFSDAALFYAGFTFRGWVAYA